jgi:hypothetical protein
VEHLAERLQDLHRAAESPPFSHLHQRFAFFLAQRTLPGAFATP